MGLVKEFIRYYKISFLGLVLILLMGLVSILAPFVAPYSPTKLNVMDPLKKPSLAHPFGTDPYGRDVLSRLIFGARLSLQIGAMVVGASAIIGMSLGTTAGLTTLGWLENLIMRGVDILMAFPSIFLALIFVGILGPSKESIIVALTIVQIPRNARIAHGKVQEIAENTYIESANAVGVSTARIIRYYILPNLLPPAIVQLTFIFAVVVMAETSLSFLGAGPPPPAPSWGNVMSQARNYIRQAPWLVIFPGITIFSFVMSINLVGDALREILDPKASASERL